MASKKPINKPYSEMDKKERLQVRKIAYKSWALSHLTDVYNKKQPFMAAASNSGLTMEQVQKLYIKDKWEQRLTNDLEKDTFKKIIEKQKQKALENIPNTEKVAETIDELLDQSGLSDKHKMFICYYLNSFNGTQAALNCGYTKHSANVASYQILNNPKVKHILDKAKELMQVDLNITSRRLIEEYARIAFTDVTEFVEFDGRRVKLKDSAKVDGRLITEVKQGKDGITVKLVDKKWAMDKLEKLLSTIPDKKLELDIKKYELQEKLVNKQLQESGEGDSKVIIINDL